MKLYLNSFLFVACTACLFARDIEYVEKFSLAEDRSVPLEELIPEQGITTTTMLWMPRTVVTKQSLKRFSRRGPGATRLPAVFGKCSIAKPHRLQQGSRQVA